MMTDLFKILAKLVEMRVHFTYQSQATSQFYNLMVKDIYNKEHYFHSSDLKDIETGLKTIWGHLLNVTTIPKPMGMPMP